MFLLAFVLTLGCLGIQGRPEVYTQPEQIHLSYGYDETQMFVTWVTRDDAKGSIVEYGAKEGGVMDKVSDGYMTVFEDSGYERRTMQIHRATMKNLVPGREYIYHVGSQTGGWSGIFTFRALRNDSEWSPTFALVGDMGNRRGVSTPYLQKGVQSKKYDAVIHIGDLAYDFDFNEGRRGDAYMNQVQPFAAYAPYMTCVGNHESMYNFSNYKNRFTMPGGDGHGIFYSVNIGPIHLVAFSSELYYFTIYGHGLIPEQYEWLERDLKEANKPENRAKQPWIVSMCHRPLYCSNDDDHEHCAFVENRIRVGIPKTHEYSIEDLLYKYGVDIHFQGHEHSYERMWPVYNHTVCNGTSENPYKNPRAPIHILSGAGGNHETKDAFLKNLPHWSAAQSMDYGYTIMKVANSTHLFLDQISVEQDGKVIDSIVVEKHARGAGLYDCHKHQEEQRINNVE